MKSWINSELSGQLELMVGNWSTLPDQLAASCNDKRESGCSGTHCNPGIQEIKATLGYPASSRPFVDIAKLYLKRGRVTWDCRSVVDCLLSMNEALGFIPSTPKS